MKKILLLLLVALTLAFGCRKKEEAKSNDEPLVPTAREREVLRAYGLTADTERGQKKLRKMRDREEKLQAARDRMTSIVEEAREREAEAAGE